MHMGKREKNILGHIFIVETLLLILTFTVYCARVTLNSLYIENLLILRIILRNEKKLNLYITVRKRTLIQREEIESRKIN